MIIVTAKNSNGVLRAFLEKNWYQGNKCAKDLLNGGWSEVTIKEVDVVMIGQIKIESMQ